MTYTVKKVNNLITKIPRTQLGFFPTPLHRLDNLSQELADCIKVKQNFNAKPGSKFMSSFINWGFYKFALKDKKFTVGDECNGCGLCEKVCPLNNVKVAEGKPTWNGNCTHCMRCICMCPQEAIEYGKASLGKWRYLCPAEMPEKAEK